MSEIITPKEAGKEQLKLAKLEAAKCTCQIFYHERDEVFTKLSPCASGVFLAARGSYFLITAAHVIESKGKFNADKFMISGVDKEMLGIYGEATFNEKYDIGVIKLDNSLYNEFSKRFTFISEHDILVDHPNYERATYFTYGFPNQMTKESKAEKGHYIAKALSFWTNVENDLPKSIAEDYPKDSYILIKYSSSGLTFTESGKRFQKHDPDGMSGSGLWWVSFHVPEPKKKLVGVLIEYPSKKGKVMVATRIEFITELLRQKYDCTFFPASKSNIKVYPAFSSTTLGYNN